MTTCLLQTIHEACLIVYVGTKTCWMQAGPDAGTRFCTEGAYLEALGDDAGLVALASRKVMVQGIDEPCPEFQHIPLLLYGEALVAAAHDCLHEFVWTHLHHNQPHAELTPLQGLRHAGQCSWFSNQTASILAGQGTVVDHCTHALLHTSYNRIIILLINN